MDNTPNQQAEQATEQAPEQPISEAEQQRRDAAELLGFSPEDADAAAKVRAEREGRQAEVPVTAVERVRAAADLEESKYQQLVERAKAHGGVFSDEGEFLGFNPQEPAQWQQTPTPQQQPDPFEKLRAYAEARGEDVQEIMGAYGPVLEAALAPLYATAADSRLEARLGSLALMDDPEDAPVYLGTLKQIIQDAPPTIRLGILSNDNAFKMAVTMAKMQHSKMLDERKEKRIEQKLAAKSGKVVGRFSDSGRFTEGAAPGSEGAPVSSLSPEALGWAERSGFTMDDIAAAEKNRTDGRGVK